MRAVLTRTLFAILVLGSIAGMVTMAEPGATLLVSMVEQLRGAGAAGVALFLVVYAAATLAMVPASWLQMAAGFLLGPAAGITLALVASTGFGTVSFGLARTSLRGPVERRLSRGGWLQTLDRAVAEGGAGTVALLRVSPLSPYNIVNYALGLTGVRLRDYLAGTVLGGALPVTLYALLGASAGDLAAVLAGEASGPVWMQWLGLSVTAIATLAVTARVRHTLRSQGLTSTGSQEPRPSSSSGLSPAPR